MTVKLTFEFDSNADAARFLQNLDEGQEVATGTDAGAKKRGPGRPPKAAEPTAAAPAAQPTVVTAPAPVAAVATVAAPAAVPFKAVADAITELADKDLTAAKGILAKFGVGKASDLKPEQFGAVVEAAKAALSPSAPAASSLI